MYKGGNLGSCCDFTIVPNDGVCCLFGGQRIAVEQVTGQRRRRKGKTNKTWFHPAGSVHILVLSKNDNGLPTD